MNLLELEKVLLNNFKAPARVVVLGIGNALRSDDFVGVAIVQKLRERIQKEAILFIEAEIAPSEFFPEIQEWNPTHLLILDAADLKAKPGTFNVIAREQMATFTLSSHKRALTLLIDLLSHYLPNLKITILGIQPASTEFNIDLNISQPIQEAIQKLTELLTSVFSRL
ncbi:MAG: hydrogenase maturation protease [Candidatus Helarchaeota archaeon]|nr:hydrogenase maturation protease [Candidatus Helarchaeota archaeon]